MGILKPTIGIIEEWTAELSAHFPRLSRPQLAVLAEASFALMTVGQWGLDTLSEFLAALYGQPESTVRSRLREWYCEASAKKGPSRQTLDVTACFAPLLDWVCELAAPDQKELALALDASTVRDRLTILCVSVIVGGGAVPVAWKMLKGNEPGSWKPHWQQLLQLVSDTVPCEWFVVVTADRGLYAAWLFDAICANGWHPLLRINTNGFMCPEGETDWRALAGLLDAPGATWRGRCTCFKTTPLTCTLVGVWDEGYAEPWLIVSDLAPDEAEARWDALRSPIERGFRDSKRGLFQWHRARVTDPERAERMWLILALAMLRFTAIGAQSRAPQTVTPPETEPASRVPRRLSLVRQGMVVMLAALVLQVGWPQGGWHHTLWTRNDHSEGPRAQHQPHMAKESGTCDMQPP